MQFGDHIGVFGRRNLKGAPPCTGTHATTHVTFGEYFVEQMQRWQNPSNQQARNVQQEHGQWSPLLLIGRVEFFASVVDQSHSAAPVQTPTRGEVGRKAAQPMPALVVLAGDGC